MKRSLSSLSFRLSHDYLDSSSAMQSQPYHYQNSDAETPSQEYCLTHTNNNEDSCMSHCDSNNSLQPRWDQKVNHAEYIPSNQPIYDSWNQYSTSEGFNMRQYQFDQGGYAPREISLAEISPAPSFQVETSSLGEYHFDMREPNNVKWINQLENPAFQVFENSIAPEYGIEMYNGQQTVISKKRLSDDNLEYCNEEDFDDLQETEMMFLTAAKQKKLKTKKQTIKSRPKHVGKACTHCKRAHLACDSQRPCKRCTHLGKEGCIDVEHKRRGRPRSSPEKNTFFYRDKNVSLPNLEAQLLGFVPAAAE